MKKRVTGIGGLFFKTKDPKASKDWYNKHLGFNTDDYGSTFCGKIKKGMIALRNGVLLKMTPNILNLPKKSSCLIIVLKT